MLKVTTIIHTNENMSSTNENFLIGTRLRQIRDDKSLSQEDFSKNINISVRGYQNYERGERTISKELICALLDTYKINPTWLLTGEGEMYQTKAAEGMVTLEGTIAWLNEWWEQADEKQRIWLEVQLKRCFPEYAEWTETQTVR